MFALKETLFFLKYMRKRHFERLPFQLKVENQVSSLACSGQSFCSQLSASRDDAGNGSSNHISDNVGKSL